MDTEVAKEKQIPLALSAIGLIVWVIVGFMRFELSPATTVVVITIDATVRTILMILVAFITAKLLSVSFGDLNAAWMKFAAVAIFPSAIAALLAFPGSGLIAAVIAFGLLMWLFDLEVYQAVVFTVLYWIVSFVAAILIAAMFFEA